MLDETATILQNEQICDGLWKMDLHAEKIPQLVQPGQFVQLQLHEKSKHVLRRPLSVQAVYADDTGAFEYLSLLYQVVGKGTEFLSASTAGNELKLLGPLGRGWQPPEDAKRVLLVGGGVGWAPLTMLLGNLRRKGLEAHALIGARNAQTVQGLTATSCCSYSFYDVALPTEAEFFGHICTDDGSMGHHGFTTEVLPELLDTFAYDYIATCGPEPMQRIIAAEALAAGVPCEVSLERRMACGIGACLSCVVETHDGKKRACVDGPVFKAEVVVW